MEAITEKQFKTIKFVRGWLLALFVLAVIGAAGAAVGFIMLFAVAPVFSKVGLQFPQQIWISLFGLIPLVIELVMLSTLLFNRQPNRKTTVSVTMLVYALLGAASSVFGVFMGSASTALMNSGYNFYGGMLSNIQTLSIFFGLGYAMSLASMAIFIIFAVCLLRKARGVQAGSLPYKLMFILYVVLSFACEYVILFSAVPITIPGFAELMVVVCIVAGFFIFMSLFPAIALFKSLDDEDFYENFIVTNPGVSINQYERAKWQSSAQPAAECFCMYCGAPLAPGSAFCRQCGKPVNRQQ